jgi:hypothetical protein
LIKSSGRSGFIFLAPNSQNKKQARAQDQYHNPPAVEPKGQDASLDSLQGRLSGDEDPIKPINAAIGSMRRFA